MRKYIFIILFLICSIVLSFRYLSHILAQKKAYDYEPSKDFYLLQKRDVVLNDTSDFVFEEFFSILSKSPQAYRFEFDEGILHIQIGDKNFSYLYEIREEKIIETYVYEQVVKEVPVYIQKPETVQSVQSEEIEYEEDYFHLHQSNYEFPAGTDIAQIIAAIQSNIDTNMQVSVDYSLLNPNQISQYPIYLYKNDEKIGIFVNIV